MGVTKENIIHVLHVDDDSNFLVVAKRILEMQGPFQVDSALSVKEAFKRIREKEYEGIVSDYQMPKKDGLQFLKELRDKKNNIPFILFTGKGREEVAIEALNLGVDRYINKIGKPETVYAELAHAILQIAEKKKSERMLEESEERFRTIFEGATDGILAINPVTQRFVFANPKFCEITGYPLKELIKLGVADIHPKTDLAYVNEQIKKQVEGKITLATDIPILRKNNQILYCDVNSMPMKIGEKQLLVGFFRNITDRKKAEEVLKKSEERYSRLLDSISNGVCLFDDEWRYLLVNDAQAHFLGMKRENLLGKSMLDLFPDLEETRFFKLFKHVKETRQSGAVSDKYAFQDGREGWYEAHVYSVPEGILCIVTDITDHKKAEEELFANNLVLTKAQQIGHTGSWIWDTETDKVTWSDELFDIYGLDKEKYEDSMTAKLIQSMTHPDDLERVLQNGADTLKTGRVEPIEYRIIRPDKTERIVIGESELIQDLKHDKVNRMIGIVQDITERKKIADKLIKNEEMLRTTTENIVDALFAKDVNRRYTFVNSVAAKMMGRSTDKIIGKTAEEIFSQKDAQTIRKLDDANFDGQKIEKMAKITLGKQERFLHSTQNPIKDVEGKIIGIVGVVRDVTEKKKTEKELEKIFDLSPDMVCVCTTEGGLLKVSPSCEKILGYTQEELLKIGWSKLVHPDDVEQTKKEVEMQLKGDSVANFVNRYRHKDGSYVVLEWQASFAEIGIVYATARDITNRKKAEEELKEKNVLLDGILENTHMMAVYLDSKFNVIFVNKAYAKTCKHPQDFFVGKNHFDVYPSEEVEAIFQKVVDTRKPFFIEARPFEFPDQPERGTTYWDWSLIPIKDSKNEITGLVFTLAEVTGRIKAELSMKEDKEEISNLAKFPSENPNPVLRVNKDGTILFSNKAIQSLFGKQKPDEKQQFLEQIQQSVLDSLRSGLSKEVEVKLEDKIFSFVFAPVVESKYVNVYGRDITGRKKVENALMGAFDEVALVNEKLGVVGRLTRHDVRNKLSAVTGNIYLAKQTLPPDSESVNYLKETESAIDQIERIFDFARMYEQLGAEELSDVDVGKSFDVAISLLQDLGKIEIENDCKGCLVLADSLLEQLFYNLMDNSLKHGEKVSKIRLYCKTEKDRLKLVYEDNGIGIPEGEKENIFGEGYGKGTGVGLHMITIMCNIYGWSIQETGKQGKGAQFTITIPKTSF